jgi:7-cyano-7-deazaguanine reductase
MSFPGARSDRVRDAEFTAICPFSDFPDFAVIRLKYVPNKRCIELKSLKLVYQFISKRKSFS